MEAEKKKSVTPIYLVGATWLGWALFGSLYRLRDFGLAILVSALVYYVSKFLCHIFCEDDDDED